MLVNQAFPLAVFVMVLHSSRFYFTFCISMSKIGISATCRTAINSREGATYSAGVQKPKYWVCFTGEVY